MPPQRLAANAARASVLDLYAELERAQSLDGLPDREELGRRMAVCRACRHFHGAGCELRTGATCRASVRWFERLMLGCPRFEQK